MLRYRAKGEHELEGMNLSAIWLYDHLLGVPSQRSCRARRLIAVRGRETRPEALEDEGHRRRHEEAGTSEGRRRRQGLIRRREVLRAGLRHRPDRGRRDPLLSPRCSVPVVPSGCIRRRTRRCSQGLNWQRGCLASVTTPLKVARAYVLSGCDPMGPSLIPSLTGRVLPSVTDRVLHRIYAEAEAASRDCHRNSQQSVYRTE
jgi:hypothetical protein